jgi:PAS domain S-box-containing protein
MEGAGQNMRITRIAAVAAVATLALGLAACGKEGTPTPQTPGGQSGAPPAQSDACTSSGTTFTAASGVDIAGSPTFTKIKSAGKVVIGVKFDQPNLGYKDAAGKRCGFDIEIAQLIASKLGIDPAKIEYKEIASANRETAIKGGEVDYYVGTYSITDKRKADVSFAGPYFVAAQDLLVRKDDTSITGAASLKGKFAARAAAELERLRFEQRLADSERRFRDLYDEAPIAYIYEDTESRFVSANRAACQLLGIAPEEVTGTIGKTLLAPTPETHETIRRAFEAMQTQGTEFAGVELELRRKDNGQPVWVQWHSKPEPDGRHTRTMLIDITRRVLAEQEKARLEQQNLYLREEIKQVHNFEEIVGQSPALLEVLAGVQRVAPTDASVLIQGETGSGKELIARAIHNASKRRDRPLIKLNCAALPLSLVESELFGHERGAFTGATQRRIGRFELAHGGTIFLDEIGEMPLETQAKLLRVLQERELERLGANQSVKVDVRVIAATNRDLKRAVREGTFREDLFYRLNVFPVGLPALRERREDIPLLIQYLLARACNRVGKRIEGVTRATMDRLVAYPWPGNVRELENLLERAVILATGPILSIDLAPTPSEAEPGKPTDGEAAAQAPVVTLEQLERQHVEAVLKRTNWVIDGERGAAKILGLHPNTLRSRLKKMGLERRDHEPS